MMTNRQINAEIKRLEALDTDGHRTGTRIQANAMALALAWAVGRWGMPFSKWLAACEKNSEKTK